MSRELDEGAEPISDEELGRKLISPHGFDPRGPVPELVVEASKTIAKLRVKVIGTWGPGSEAQLSGREIDQLFDAAAICAEWTRELHEAVHLSALSAAPAEDGLRAENERFRTALETIVKNYGTEFSWHVAHAALSPPSPTTPAPPSAPPTHPKGPPRMSEAISDDDLAAVRKWDAHDLWDGEIGARLIARLDTAESRLSAANAVVEAAREFKTIRESPDSRGWIVAIAKLDRRLDALDSTPPTTTDHPPTSEGPT